MSFVGDAIGSVVGGITGANQAAKGAERAADIQGQAMREANELQREIWQQSRQDQEPWRDAGGAAVNRLAYLMGVGGYGGTSGSSGGQSQNLLTENQIREQLTPQFTSQTSSGASGFNSRPQYVTVYDGTGNDQDTGRQVLLNGGQQTSATTQVDQAGLNAAVQQRLQEQQAQQQAAQQASQQATMQNAQQDPAFGSLLRQFTMNDYLEDPGYKFRLQQGEQAINRAASAAGRYDSGRALKDLNEFNSGLASQEFGNAFDRWNVQQGNTYNRLAGLAGVGQTANAQSQQAGQNYANQAGQGLAGIANAQGGAAIAKGNAVGNSFNSLLNIGGMAAGYFSDRRLKRDIKQIAIAENGLPLYAFKYLWDDATVIGHMADEVAEKFPEHVHKNDQGYLMVDYGSIYGND